MSERQDLEAAIAALEARRDELGDKVTEVAISSLREKLDALHIEGWATDAQRLRQVTVLFTDIVSSTDMARRLDPEDVHAILDGALERFTAIVSEHHGRVLQYAGDSLLAAFGADESHEEDPENAVRAGLAFLEEALRIAREVENRHRLTGFNVRVGVNTGRVLLGGGVDAEGSIRGVTVNVAARMEQSAPPGGLRISHDTYRHVRGVFEVAAQPPIDIKGIAESVRSYLVYAVKPRAFRVASRGVDGIETPMVGRDRELTRLRDAFTAVFGEPDRGQRDRMITVVADAGIGKSRLLYEFEDWAEARPEKYYLFKGRAQPQTRQQPYGLLRDILAWRLSIAVSDSADTARAKLSDRVAPLFGPDEAAHVDLLGHLIGLDFSSSPHLRGVLDDPEQLRSRGFHAAAQVFRRLVLSNQQPAILLLDDLHWADSDSLDFLSYLHDVNRDVPILIIGLARPELYDGRAEWPGAGSTATRINLSALDPGQSDELAGILLQRLSEVPAKLREIITDGAAGNPFFMEELVKMFIDDGAIVSDIDEWRLVPDKLRSARVPTTMTGLLQARLDRLSPDERTTLQQASVVGYVFWDRALDVESSRHLQTLVQRELIVRQTSSIFVDAGEYNFHHHVLRQVTYDSVLKRDRRQYHLRTARWLEQRVGEREGEYLGAIADHYERAGDRERAVTSYTRAAEEAASRHSRDATLHYVGRALALCDDDEHVLRWRLLGSRERILVSQDDRDAHDADLDALERTADALADDALRAEALLRRANASIKAGDYPAAEETCCATLEFAALADATAIAAQACATRAFALRRMADFERSRQVADTGLSLARRCGNRQAEGEILSNLAGLAAESGDLVEGMRLSQRNLEITRAAGDKAAETNALNMLGDNTFRLGDYETARFRFDESLRLSRGIGHRYGECIVLLNLALIANLQGADDEAVEFARQSIAIAVPSGARDLEAAALLPFGLAQIERRCFDEAREALTRSTELFEQNGCPHLAMEPVAGLARLALAQRHTTEALRHAKTILAHLEAGGVLDGTEEPLRIRWTCYEALRDAADARAHYWLAETHAQLQRRADRITDFDLRRTFLGNVPHNRSIAAAWAGAQV